MPVAPRRKPTFTLVEMAITVGIVALLAAIAIPELMDNALKARKAEIYVNLDGIQNFGNAYAYTYDLDAWAWSDPRTGNVKFWMPTIDDTCASDSSITPGKELWTWYPCTAEYTGGYFPDGQTRCRHWFLNGLTRVQCDLDADTMVMDCIMSRGNSVINCPPPDTY